MTLQIDISIGRQRLILSNGSGQVLRAYVVSNFGDEVEDIDLASLFGPEIRFVDGEPSLPPPPVASAATPRAARRPSCIATRTPAGRGRR